MSDKDCFSGESGSFTQSFEALEQILEQFKQGAPTLEESLTLFETGISHLKICQERLSKAKGSVEELAKTLRDGGECVTKPLDLE